MIKISQLTLFSCIYFATAILGIKVLALAELSISLLWMASGIGLIMCLRYGLLALPFIALSSFLANFWFVPHHNLANALLLTTNAALINAIMPLFGSLIYAKILPKRIRRPSELYRFTLLVCLVPSLICALLLLANLHFMNFSIPIDDGFFLLTITIGDSFGILLVYMIYNGLLTCKTISKVPTFEQHLIIISSVLLIYFSFYYIHGLIYLLLAIMVFTSYRQHLFFLGCTLLINVWVLYFFVTIQFGPFEMNNLEQSYFSLELFVMMLIFLPLTILMHNNQTFYFKNKAARMQNKAFHDQLTGLLNRQGFYPIMDELRKKHINHGFCLAIIDIDHFKKINDQFGHNAGDLMLKKAAQLFRKHFRGEDIITRFGGEEFVIVMSDIAIENANQRLTKLLGDYAAMVNIFEGKQIRSTISIGAICCENVGKVNQLIKEADQLLYQAKNSGRNQLVLKQC